MKLTMFISLIVMILFCVIGFTQNEFITEVDASISDTISAEITFNTVRTWDIVNLEIIEIGIQQNTAPVTLIKNDGNFPNPFNYSLGTDQHVLNRAAGTQNYKDEFTYLYIYKTISSRIDTPVQVIGGHDILKCPTSAFPLV